MNLAHLFSFLTLLPIIILGFIPAHRISLLRPVALWFSIFPFFFALLSLFPVGNSASGWFSLSLFSWIPLFNLSYLFGIDGVSLSFILLSTFLIPICFLASWESIRYRFRSFAILLFFTEFCLINVFSTLDLLLFYIFFEAVAIPMFIIIGMWGSRLRRIGAAFRFLLYTLLGSLLMLIGLVYLYFMVGTFSLPALLSVEFPDSVQSFLWLSFFCSFAVKIPMVPFHVWLPEAHVEAPTAGSVLLAGILLKLGGYGLFRFSLTLFPAASLRFAPILFLMAMVAIIYSSLSTLVQVDLKKAVAYSSVAHMNYSVLGLFSDSVEGVAGALLLMISHGLVSSGLFLCVGFLYDRYGSRLLRYYGGLASVMPVYSSVFLLLTLANLSLPGTLPFVSEFLVLVGIFSINTLVGAGALFGVVLGAAYSLWLYGRLCFGPLPCNFKYFGDLNRRELSILLPLVSLTILFGVKAEPLLLLFNHPSFVLVLCLALNWTLFSPYLSSSSYYLCLYCYYSVCVWKKQSSPPLL